jgi:hypothetical protein
MDKFERVTVPFFQVPNEVYEMDLKLQEQSIYIYLCRCNNNGSTAFPSHQTIGKKTGMGKMSVIRSIESLVEKGLIKKIKRIKVCKNGTTNDSNIYQVNFNLPSIRERLGVVSEMDYPSIRERLGVVSEMDTINNKYINNSNKELNNNNRDTNNNYNSRVPNTNLNKTPIESKEPIKNLNTNTVEIDSSTIEETQKKIETIGSIKKSKVTELLKTHGVDKINLYVNSFNKFNCTKNPIGFLIKAINESWDIPKTSYSKPDQSYNFDQREYDEDYWEKLENGEFNS